ncbi:MAG: hypothetical protein WBE74_15390 [Terracidiphilus sp.]
MKIRNLLEHGTSIHHRTPVLQTLGVSGKLGSNQNEMDAGNVICWRPFEQWVTWQGRMNPKHTRLKLDLNIPIRIGPTLASVIARRVADYRKPDFFQNHRNPKPVLRTKNFPSRQYCLLLNDTSDISAPPLAASDPLFAAAESRDLKLIPSPGKIAQA